MRNWVIARDLLWAAIGGGVALTLALYLTGYPQSPLLLASLGGSTVFLFALTDAPAAQPRALWLGHLIGAAVGITVYQWAGDTLWTAVAAVVITMLIMKAADAIHPPAGANPLLMLHAHGDYTALYTPVVLGVGILFTVTLIWSRARPGIRYPVNWW